MSVQKLFRRGFKKDAENWAIEYRERLALSAWSPLDAFSLAKHLGCAVYPASAFIDNTEELALLAGKNGHDNCGWSALTMENAAGKRVIIYNQNHAAVRQQSDIMHEIAHIICGHKNDLSLGAIALPFYLRKLDEVQEAEACYLGAALQLSKAGLFWAKKREMSNEAIAGYFNASIEMVNYRLNISGVAKQLSYRRRAA
jgi:Zn-dependent peptidase ImmA (M78 family)